jgi:hypothetical protein
MIALTFSHGRVVEVEPSPAWAALEVEAVADANARLTALVETWPALDATQQARELRLAIWDLVTVTLGGETQGALWTNTLAKRCGLRKTQLREIVEYRAGLIENLPLLAADNHKETTAELCRLILT